MALRIRLARLEQLAPIRRCSHCEDRRGRIVLVTMRQTPEGLAPGDGEALPGPCPRCGQLPEQVIEIVEAVVASDSGEELTAEISLAHEGQWS